MAHHIPPEAAETLAKQEATPVDLYRPLELAILRELTHTNNGGDTDDLANPAVNTVGGAGWGYMTSDLEGDAYNDTESVAFMGLLSKLVQLGFTVDLPVICTSWWRGNSPCQGSGLLPTRRISIPSPKPE